MLGHLEGCRQPWLFSQHPLARGFHLLHLHICLFLSEFTQMYSVSIVYVLPYTCWVLRVHCEEDTLPALAEIRVWQETRELNIDDKWQSHGVASTRECDKPGRSWTPCSRSGLWGQCWVGEGVKSVPDSSDSTRAKSKKMGLSKGMKMSQSSKNRKKGKRGKR